MLYIYYIMLRKLKAKFRKIPNNFMLATPVKDNLHLGYPWPPPNLHQGYPWPPVKDNLQLQGMLLYAAISVYILQLQHKNSIFMLSLHNFNCQHLNLEKGILVFFANWNSTNLEDFGLRKLKICPGKTKLSDIFFYMLQLQ